MNHEQRTCHEWLDGLGVELAEIHPGTTLNPVARCERHLFREAQMAAELVKPRERICGGTDLNGTSDVDAAADRERRGRPPERVRDDGVKGAVAG
jgi:hypothetical protein